MQRRWQLIFGIAALSAALAALWAAAQPKVFESHVTLQYQTGPEVATNGPLAADGIDLSLFRVEKERITTEQHLLRSRSLAERAVRRLGLVEEASSTAKPSDGAKRNVAFERAVAQVLASTTISRAPASRFLTVAVRASSPAQAANVANALVDAYLEKAAEDRVAAGSRALEWLRAEQTSLKQEVEASEVRVFKFHEDHASMSASLEERRKALTDRHEAFSRATTDLRIRQVYTQARLSVLKEAIAAQPDPLLVNTVSIVSSPVVLALRERFRNVEATLLELSAFPESESPKISTARAELAAIRAQLAREIDALLKTTQLELKEIERSQSGLQQAMAELNQQSSQLSREELELAGLERERASQNERYRLVLERTAQADLARALATPPAHVVDRAVPEPEPVSPRIAFAAVLGGLAGLTLSILAVLGGARFAGAVDQP